MLFHRPEKSSYKYSVFSYIKKGSHYLNINKSIKHTFSFPQSLSPPVPSDLERE